MKSFSNFGIVASFTKCDGLREGFRFAAKRWCRWTGGVFMYLPYSVDTLVVGGPF